jgi:5-methylcytosine-specific restriction endonuclease McrA
MPGKIPIHKPEGLTSAASDARAYRKAPGRAELEAFYNGRRWRKLSTLYRAQHPTCIVCEGEGVVTPATQVHHVKEVSTHPALAYDWNNLNALCTRCHNRMRARATLVEPVGGG